MNATTIELDWGNHNRPVPVIPLGQAYRSHWRLAFEDQDAGALPDGVELPSEVPGIRVTVDPSKQSVRVYDPLHDMAERPNIAAAFLAAYNRHLVPLETIALTGVNETDLKAWMDWQSVAVLYDVARRIHDPDSQ